MTHLTEAERQDLLRIIEKVEAERQDLRHETEWSYWLITLARYAKAQLSMTQDVAPQAEGAEIQELRERIAKWSASPEGMKALKEARDKANVAMASVQGERVPWWKMLIPIGPKWIR